MSLRPRVLGRGNGWRNCFSEQDPQSAKLCSVDGFTPLHFACFFSQPQTAALLLEHGADGNAVAQNAMKVTPLHSATAARNLPIVTLLLTHGASPNVRSVWRMDSTALRGAASEIRGWLVENTAQTRCGAGGEERRWNHAGGSGAQVRTRGDREVAWL